jgi:hypothetical protein
LADQDVVGPLEPQPRWPVTGGRAHSIDGGDAGKQGDLRHCRGRAIEPDQQAGVEVAWRGDPLAVGATAAGGLPARHDPQRSGHTRLGQGERLTVRRAGLVEG